jgi:hypothetical protein
VPRKQKKSASKKKKRSKPRASALRARAPAPPPFVRHILPPREVAQRLVDFVWGRQLASEFLQNYSREFQREDVIAHADRTREILSILEREILLAMCAHVSVLLAERLRLMPRRRFAPRSAADDSEKYLRDLVAAVGRARHWTAGDVVEFRGELNLYREIIHAEAKKRVRTLGAARASAITGSGPFVDRCAFLLDPSMMENARRAFGQFLPALEALTKQLAQPTAVNRPQTRS